MSGLQAYGRTAKTGAALFGVVLFVGLMALVTLLSTLVWPGQLRYVGQLRCDAAHPDVMVVEDTYQTTDGTSTDFTIYCVSPGGDAIDKGFARSFVTLWASYSIALGALVGAVLARRTFRRRRLVRQRGTTPPSTPRGRSRSADRATAERSAAAPDRSGVRPGGAPWSRSPGRR